MAPIWYHFPRNVLVFVLFWEHTIYCLSISLDHFSFVVTSSASVNFFQLYITLSCQKLLLYFRNTTNRSTMIRSPSSKKLKVRRQPSESGIRRKLPRMSVPEQLQKDFTPNTPSPLSVEIQAGENSSGKGTIFTDIAILVISLICHKFDCQT